MPDSKFLTVDKLSIKEITKIFSRIRVNSITQCWEWTGSLSRKGYAATYYRGRLERTHRLLYAWTIGPIPRGVDRNIPVLDHVACENPSCVNPVHVEPRTQRQNIMRGNGACANNARKTHCPRGHLLPVIADLRYGPSRRCSTCLYQKRHIKERIQRKAEYDRQRLMRQKSKLVLDS
jgi:hypothetical protein